MNVRVVRSDGVVLAEQSLGDAHDDAPDPDLLALFAADMAVSALLDGYGFRLEASDPEGRVWPKDFWFLVDERAPQIHQ